MQKFEYCMMTLTVEGGRLLHTLSGRLTFLTPAGNKAHPILRDKKMGDDNVWHAAFRIIANMGNDGWEMIGMDSTSTPNDSEHTKTYWFKRPKS